MKVKICGLTDKENTDEVLATEPDFVGFIFYKGSKRYVDKVPSELCSKSIKVGVFVNANFEEIYRVVSENELDMVQLHGDESPAFCTRLRNAGLSIIKAIPVRDHIPQELIKAYDVDMLLFDTDGPQKGGNGYAFDWRLLTMQKIEKPFMIGGGLDFDSIQKIKALQIDNLIGLDFNSRLEDRPGIKNIEKVKQIIHGIRN